MADTQVLEACGAIRGGSSPSTRINASVAQLVERDPEEVGVRGSIPLGGIIGDIA